MVVPVIPTRPWYGLLIRDAKAVYEIARKGDTDVFLQPSLDYEHSVGPLPWDLIALQFDFTS